MGERNQRRHTAPLFVTAAALLLAIGALGHSVAAQAQGAGTATPQTRAPIDMTGNWVSLVTEDWRWRMVTLCRGGCREGERAGAQGPRRNLMLTPARGR